MMEQFAQDELEFTQNSVPFAYDGDHLLWMNYLQKGKREVYIYNFEQKQRETVLSFGSKDGIISHCKLVGKGSSLKVLYVKECTQIFEFDVTTKQTRKVGVTKDAVLAMHV
jgi:hypothetical protein